MQWRVGMTQGQPPPARYFHAAAVVGNRVYIFGTARILPHPANVDSALHIYRWNRGGGYPIK